MIRYLIVEDEKLAHDELKRMIGDYSTNYIYSGHTETIVQTINFLKKNEVDIIFMDIRLSDGDCFEVFEHITVSTPIIFTTAYDEHAIQAFRVNSIDYLLKPIEEEGLFKALNKFERLFISSDFQIKSYRELSESVLPKVKNRYLIQTGDTFSYINNEDIAFFYSEDKAIFLHTFADKRYIINYTLEELEKMIGPQLFFRVSRNCIANIQSVSNISKYFNSRLKITFQPRCPQEVLVSRVRVSDFLRWVDGFI
jgi:DNA-binding LytR/AlgR family response regulator